jgi:methylthioribose-1-phosphate isomerase
MSVRPVLWEDGQLRIIDQTLLPTEYRVIPLDSREAVWNAIKTLQVRGAPAIGVCAAFGVLVALKETAPYESAASVARGVHQAADYLATSRPTAVNLFWALDRMRAVADQFASEADGPQAAEGLLAALEQEAELICQEDTERCRAIGEHGATLLKEGDGVLTHCNAGALATSAHGTALSVMFAANELGRTFRVYADETRPLLQGARLTAWELMQAGVDVTLICDNTAAQVMREGRVQLVVTGADRIAANGDAANKIGTYSVALLAKAHGIPFYVAAPLSTFDPKLASGDLIPIEQRAAEEVTHGFGKQTAPDGVDVYSPAFDVTPADLIAGLITEAGILRPPYHASIAKALADDAAGRTRPVRA